jgi:hypothetical protein
VKNVKYSGSKAGANLVTKMREGEERGTSCTADSANDLLGGFSDSFQKSTNEFSPPRLYVPGIEEKVEEECCEDEAKEEKG